MNKYKFFTLLILSLVFTLNCHLMAAFGDVIINEFCWQGSGGAGFGSYDEWIELRNTTGAGVNITGWHLTIESSSTYVINLPAVTIPANGFLVVSKQNNPGVNTVIGSFAGIDVTSASFTIANSSNFHMILGDNSLATVDEAGDGTNSFFLSGSTEYKSMERNIDYSLGTSKTNWHLCRSQTNIFAGQTFAGTPGNANSARYGSIIINEIMWAGSPYIELYSQMTSNIDITGWKIVGSTSGNVITFGAGTTINTNSYFLIKKDNSSTSTAADVTSPTLTLSGTGEKLELQNLSGITVDIVNHVGNWYSGNNQNGGMAMERNSFSDDGELESSWHCAMGSNGGRYGTPSTVNSVPTALDISINEIFWAGTTKEYIEIINNKSYPISLHNWHIWNNNDSSEIPCSFTPDDVIPANGYFIVSDPALSVTVPKNNPAIDLGPSGETIIIRDFAGNSIDSVVNYGTSWFGGTSTNNSMERNDPSYKGNLSYNWRTSRYYDSTNSLYGTPGYKNSIDGTGNATISPAGPINAGSEDEFTITFTSEADLSGGDVSIEIPPGWSLPTLSAGNKGYVQVTPVNDVNHGTPVVNTTTLNGQTININFTTLKPNQSVKIVYGAGGAKSKAQLYSGNATFNIKTKESGGTLTQISVSPVVQVKSSTGNGPTLLLNEIAFESGGGGFDNDWVEIFCSDDGNNGNGANIEGYYIDDIDGSADKTFGLLVIKSGEYLIVHYNDAVSTDETERSGDAIDVYTSDSGLTGTDEQVVIYTNTATVVDAVCWSDDPISASEATDVTTLSGVGQWNINYGTTGVAEWIDCVDSSPIGSGNSIIRDKNSTDTNDKSDWSKTTIPTPGLNNASGPTANAKFLITEVSMLSSTNDWIEVYCVDDGNFGNGGEIGGYYFQDDNKIKTIADDTVIRTGEFLLLTFNSTNTDEKTATNGTVHIYTTDTGLTGTDEQAIFFNHLGTTIDAVCWSDNNGTLASSEKDDIQDLVNSGQWMTSAAESTCVDISDVIPQGSIYRARSKNDTNLKTDWFVSVKPTPGTYNAESGEAVKIVFDNQDTQYQPINMEKDCTLKLLDPFGNLAVNSVVSANIYSNSHSTKFSNNSGISWSQDITVTFMKGIANFKIKNTAIENVTITAISESESVQDAIKGFIFIREPPVIISEIMYNPGTIDDSDLEWVELYNRSTSSVELKNWTIESGTSKTTIPEGVKIAPGEYVVIASELTDGTDADTDSFATIYGDKNGTWDPALDGFQAIDGSLSMSNDSSVILSSPEGHKIEFKYNEDLGGSGNDHTLEKLDNNIIDRGDINVDRYNWTESSVELGTPGKANSVVPAGLPTNMIVNHTPVTLAPLGEAINIAAEVKTAQVITSAKLYYKRENESSYRSQDMVKIENTNLYQGIIPDEFLDNESILYYIEITDSDETVFSPTDGSSNPNKIATVDMVPKLKIVPDYKGVSAGEVFDVEIRLENAINIVGATFEMTYDNDAFEIVDQNENRNGNQLKIGTFMGNGFAEINQADGGLIQFSISGLADEVNGDGVIAVAKFKIKSALAKKYDFKFTTAMVTDKDGTNTVPALFSGQIEYGLVSSDLVGPKGATITGPDEMKLTIVKSALKSVQRIGIVKLTSGDSSLPSFADMLINNSNLVSVGKAYWIQPDTLRFYRTCELVFPYSSDELEAVGLTSDDEQYLTLYRYNRETGDWDKAGGKVDKSGNTLTLQILNGGIYLLVKDPTKAPSFFVKALYPTVNPFSPNGNGINDYTDIMFDLSDEADITLRIYDTRGKLLKTLADGENYASGLTGIEWDGKDDYGNALKTGIYIIHIYAKDDYDRKTKLAKTVVISNHMFE